MALSGAEKMAKWRRENPDRAAAIVKKHRLKHKDQLNEKAKLRARAWRELNPEESKKRQRDWYAANPTKRKAQQLWRYYRLHLEEFNRLREHQNNCCALCLNVLTLPCVDHNHSDGEIRGLLCMRCNHLLHRGKDSEEFLLRLIDYIKKPPARTIKIVGRGEINPTR